MGKEIIYVGDPLCGWCFGFTKIFEEIMGKYQNQVNFSIVMGGLKVDHSIIINKKIKKFIHNNWLNIMNKTGQNFSVDLVDQIPDGEYNSEPPCRAVVTVRELNPEAALPYYKALHKEMYLNVKNNTESDFLYNLAVKTGVPGEKFLEFFNSEEMKNLTERDFEFSKNSGVLGFPAFVLKDETGSFVLNQGYKPLEDLVRGIEGWLRGERTIIF